VWEKYLALKLTPQKKKRRRNINLIIGITFKQKIENLICIQKIDKRQNYTLV
jgi:hypothetical protein